MTAFIVVNPHSANGRTRQDWPRIKPELEKLFPLMQVAESHARGETARLVRAALRDGHLDVIAVGGDGTINEAVNGFFENGAPVSPDAVFGFVSSGNDSNFRRTFGITPAMRPASRGSKCRASTGWMWGMSHASRPVANPSAAISSMSPPSGFPAAWRRG